MHARKKKWLRATIFTTFLGASRAAIAAAANPHERLLKISNGRLPFAFLWCGMSQNPRPSLPGRYLLEPSVERRLGLGADALTGMVLWEGGYHGLQVGHLYPSVRGGALSRLIVRWDSDELPRGTGLLGELKGAEGCKGIGNEGTVL